MMECRRSAYRIMHIYPVFPVRLWPSQHDSAKIDFLNGQPVVLGILQPAGWSRDSTRQELRLATCKFLADCLQIAPDDLVFHTVPGEKSHIRIHEEQLHTSISHEDGLSVIVLSRSQAAGIDILRLPPDFDWLDLANLYLGSQQADAILRAPRSQHTQLFARAWTLLEARCKYSGIPLTEFSEMPQQHMADDCRTNTYCLDLPGDYSGSLVLAKTTNPP